MTFGVTTDGGAPAMFGIDGTGMVEIYMSALRKCPAFAEEARRAELRRRIVEIPVSLERDSLDRYPQFPIEALWADEAFERFTAVAEWFRKELRPG